MCFTVGLFDPVLWVDRVNIFFLDTDPRLAAQAHVDKHVSKMIVETAQLLCTAHHLDPDTEPHPDLYKPTHQNHPSARWVRQNKANYWWAYRLFLELGTEYTHRYYKRHATTTKLFHVLSAIPASLFDTDIGITEITPPPSCMPDDLKLFDDSPDRGVEAEYSLRQAVANYRNYYKHGKADLHRWTRRDPPEWIR